MVSRRRFFRLLLRDFAVSRAELYGEQHFKLIDLPKLSDEELSRIVPRVMDEQHLWIDDGVIWASRFEDECPQRVCAAGDPEAEILHRFGGGETLGEISEALADTFGLDLDAAFRRSRDFFLVLAVSGLCAPANTTLWSTAPRPYSPAADEDGSDETSAFPEA